MITMRIVWVLDVKKVAYEVFGPFAKVKAPENVHKNIFLAKSLDWNKQYRQREVFN